MDFLTQKITQEIVPMASFSLARTNVPQHTCISAVVTIAPLSCTYCLVRQRQTWSLCRPSNMLDDKYISKIFTHWFHQRHIFSHRVLSGAAKSRLCTFKVDACIEISVAISPWISNENLLDFFILAYIYMHYNCGKVFDIINYIK
jgi:hypothetical protein